MARPRSPPPPPPATGAAPLVTASLLAVAEDTNGPEYYRRLVDPLNRHAHACAVDTPLRLAHFLAQVAHESGIRATEENGSHAPQAMRELFGCKGGPAGYDRARDDCLPGPGGKPARLRPKLWSAEATYAHHPRNLLSYVYALHLGNGDEVSGDGYRYRGRGLLHLTGKADYRAFTARHNNAWPGDRRDFVAHPELVSSELDYAIEAAFHVWDDRGLNTPADQDDIREVTRGVDPSLDGLADRAARLARIKRALGI